MARASLLFPIALLVAQGLLFISTSFAGDCDSQCSTDNCDDDGRCICKLPQNDTMLQGDRLFLGGEFCDTPRTMCDGSNDFWCEHGECNEIIQGENYTCKCKDGYSGERCDFQGEKCGDSFCYHGATCVQGAVLCDCPAEWKGREDCSLPTLKSPSKNDTTPGETFGYGHNDKDKWYFPFSGVVAAVVVAFVVFIGVKMLKKRSAKAIEFHKLQQVQMRGFIEEDEDTFSHQPLSKAELA